VNISGQVPGNKEVKMKLVTVLGEQVWAEKFVLNADGKFNSRFDVSKLVAGIYLLQVCSGNEMAVKKIIVTK
jgi:hypothetical protein